MNNWLVPISNGVKKLIPQSIKNIYHLFEAIFANIWYGFPSKNIKIIGVTGTNGKTTTVWMISRILEESGAKVGLASTINFKLGEKEWVNKTKFTTLSSFAVQKFIKQAVQEKCDYLILETSSHALDQNRVWGVKYQTAVITNVTREHLDYHHNMEEYRIAKLKLFEMAKISVVNFDMENANDYLDCVGKIKYTFSAKPQPEIEKYDLEKVRMIRADGIELGINYSKFKAEKNQFSLQLPGLFNIENALAAISVGISEKIDIKIIQKALEKIKGVPGRMEHVSNDRGVDIIVDYAVTPDSLEKMYALISQIKKEGSRVFAVFGSCGERDRGKRPIMGKIVSKNADYVIVTNEDPYNEDPMQIINEVASGVEGKKENENYWRMLDRREAIKKALALAKAGDIVVVTGKGAEETMAVGDKRIPWNDKKVIQEVLQELGSK